MLRHPTFLRFALALTATGLAAQSSPAVAPRYHLPGTDIVGCSSLSDCDTKCAHDDAAICRRLAEAYSFQRQGDAAHGYYIRACAAGMPADCRAIGVLYETGNGVLLDRDRAKGFYEVACRRGDRDGCTAAKQLHPAPPPEPARPAPEPLPAFTPQSNTIDCQPGDVVPPAALPLRPGVAVFKEYEAEQPPQLIPESRSNPCYPDLARQQGLNGKAVLEMVIDEQGVVVDARVIRSDNAIFNGVSLATVRRWRYLPALMNGRPVAVYKSVTLSFTLH